ncbi:PAS domain-containing sensor histidine kinase [Candidatus Dactylopiibacterium carminicum]|nr:PAS domain-containing sensor histidine kinase [Candidatus Dactylopiibacterium carminicum]
MTPRPTPRPGSRSLLPAVLVVVLAAFLGVVWFVTQGEPLPGTYFAPERSSVVAVVVLVSTAAWGVWLASQQRQRVGEVEEERDLFFTLSLDIFCVLSADGRFERVNPAILNTLGLKPENLVEGSSLLDLVHADDTRLVSRGLAALEAGHPARFEVRCRCGDGSWRWLNWSATPTPEEGQIYAVAHDVTGRKHTEEALRAESAFRTAMEDSVLTGLRAIDAEGRIIYVNRAFCELVGWPLADLLHKRPPFPYWDESDASQNEAKLGVCLEGKAPSEGMELRIRRRDGKRRDVRLHVSPLIDAHGDQTGWMTAMTDIREQKRARNELQAANERITTVLDGLDSLVFVTDIASNEVLYTNLACAHQIALGGANPVVPNPDPVDYPLDPATLTKKDLPCELFDGELQHPRTGQWFHLRERALRWVDGRIARLAVATDITAMRRAEEVTREQEASLARTSRLITMGEMASTLAHELNQPLSAISNYSKGCVNRLRSGQYKIEDILGAMDKAATQAARAGEIVRRVRDFVRKSEPRRSMVSLAQITEDALGIAGIEVRRLGARVSTRIPPDLPEVLADRIMIEQVLMNLVRNAAEAMQEVPMEQRQITIGAQLHEDSIEMMVADRGCGISPENQANLFSPFFTTKPDDMGMGLNICRSIIEFHKGRLWIEDNPPGGTIFRFTLPLENDLEPEPREQDTSPA